MTMYRIQRSAQRLQPFRSSPFGDRYMEKDLEDWLEANPSVILDGEPALIIDRQVPTSWGGTMDLLGIDVDGATLIIELKRAPTPRDVIAQVLEYASWAAELDAGEVRSIASQYFAQKRPSFSLEEAWGQAFGPAGEEAEAGGILPQADLQLNSRQRIFIVAEGRDERLATVIRYLRSKGLDINLLEYGYYQTDSGEEILDLEIRVGPESPLPGGITPIRPSEEKLLAAWPEDLRQTYAAFKDSLTKAEGIIMHPTKSAMSFYRQARDGRVFICYFASSSMGGHIALRRDSLEGYVDLESAVAHLQDRIDRRLGINRGPVWVSVHFPPSRSIAEAVAAWVIEEVASRIS